MAFWSKPKLSLPLAQQRFHVDPFVDWLHDLMARAKESKAHVEALTPEEVEEFVR